MNSKTAGKAIATVSPTTHAAEQNLSVRDLMLSFEGFGDNCEFGFIQRRLGAEPLGLFRFSWVGLAELIQCLENRFISLDNPESLEVYLQGNEYFVRFGNDFNYHTFIVEGQEEAEVIRRRQFARNKFLRRNLIESLESGGKIIVRKGQSPTILDEVLPLYAALRTYGPNTLLWVVPATIEYPPGTVEVLEEGLLRGYVGAIGVLAPFVDTTLDDWVQVCSKAYQLWHGEAPPVTPILPNLLVSPDVNGSLTARSTEHASVEVVAGQPIFGDESTVLQHKLYAATVRGPIMVCNVRGASEGPNTYVLSALVWLPASFEGRAVAPVFLGCPTVAAQYASLGLRDQWQHIWATAEVPGLSRMAVGLNLIGGGDDVVYTTRWRLEQSDYPSEYLPQIRRPAPPTAQVPLRPNLLPPFETLEGSRWMSHAEVASNRSDAVPAFVADETVLQHTTRTSVDGVVFDRMLDTNILSGLPHMLSIRLWIPELFDGKAVVPVFGGFATVESREADLSLRACWQRIWAKAIIPKDQRGCAPALRMRAGGGNTVFTTCWKVEQGDIPTAFEPRRRNWIPDADTFATEGWSSGAGATVTPSGAPAPVPGAVVLTHRLVHQTNGNNMTVHQRTLSIDSMPTGDVVLSIWLCVPPEFRGLMICPQIDRQPSRALYPASLSTTLRGRWQRIWAYTTVEASKSPLIVRLLAIGAAGATFQSACWQLENACTPSPYWSGTE